VGDLLRVRREPLEAERLHRLGLPANRNWRVRLSLDRRRQHPPRLRPEQDLTRRRDLRQLGRDADGRPSDGRLRRAGQDRPGVNAHPQLERHGTLTRQHLGQRSNGVAHLGRRPHRSERVVFVDCGHAEDPECRVAAESLDLPAVPLDRRLQRREVPVQREAERFQVSLVSLRKRRDPRDEHRDRLALSPCQADGRAGWRGQRRAGRGRADPVEGDRRWLELAIVAQDRPLQSLQIRSGSMPGSSTRSAASW
jgi:hypothetical protein